MGLEPSDPQKLAFSSPTSGGCLVGIVLLRTKATEFFLLNFNLFQYMLKYNVPAYTSLIFYQHMNLFFRICALKIMMHVHN
jgi:hypothetical protein